MKHLCFCILLSMYSIMSVAQTDSIKYYNKDWKLTNKDSAYYFAVSSFSDGLYKRNDYFSKTNKLQMEGAYLDKNEKLLQGLFKWYYENGVMSDSVFYDNGKRLRGWSFYESGNKRAAFTVVADSVIAQGWDENGKEISNYVLEKKAEFPGGSLAYRKFLEKNLQKDIASKNNAPNGNYTVKIELTITEKGKVSDVKVINYPPMCPLCAVEAARVMQKVPNWIPAVQFGKAVPYKAIQYVTFQVANH